MAQIKTLLLTAGIAIAAAAVSATPAQACNHHRGCSSSSSSSSTSTSSTSSTSSSTGSTGSTGGTDVPAPAALGLFAASAIGLIARRRRARG